MEQKNICIFNSSKFWGGGEKWHYDFATALIQNGYTVYAFVYKDSPLHLKLEELGVNIILVDISNQSFLNPLQYFYLYRKLKETNSEKLILSLPSDVKVCSLPAKLAGFRKIIYRRGTALPLRNNLYNKLIYQNWITDIVANSEHIRNILLAENKNILNKNRVHVIYNGIRTGNEPNKAIDYPSLNGKVIRIGNIGRCVEQKKQEYLILLAEKLKDRGFAFVIEIVGEGRLKPKLIRLVKEKDSEECVVFRGFVQDVQAFLEHIDIFVSTSMHEGTSNAVLEVMNEHIPVIAFNVSSMPEYIKDQQTGLLVDYGDVEDLAEKVGQLAEDPQMRRRLGEEGAHRIQTRYNFDVLFQRWMAMLEE